MGKGESILCKSVVLGWGSAGAGPLMVKDFKRGGDIFITFKKRTQSLYLHIKYSAHQKLSIKISNLCLIYNHCNNKKAKNCNRI